MKEGVDVRVALSGLLVGYQQPDLATKLGDIVKNITIERTLA